MSVLNAICVIQIRSRRNEDATQEILHLIRTLERDVISNKETADMQLRLGNIFAKEENYNEAILYHVKENKLAFRNRRRIY
jgi:hypothetical protein